jgi:ferrous iron transport protein A
MGLIPGTIVKILSNNGRMKILVRDTEVALGHDMAAKIMAIPSCGCQKRHRHRHSFNKIS